jgi:hypothetical protein
MSGCAAGVLRVAPPSPANAVVTICDQLNDQLPNLLEHLQSRPTTPRSPLVHAWGNSHPVVLRCGVPKPAGYSDSSAQTAVVDGVAWFQQIEPNQVTWTAVRRTANIELTVPRTYQAQGAFLVDIGGAISASIR